MTCSSSREDRGILQIMQHAFISKAAMAACSMAIAGCSGVAAAGTDVSPVRPHCDLSAPPAESGVNSNHGHVFFVYPRVVDDAFTGCQKTWMESGELWVELEFVQGRLVHARMVNEGETSDCRYDEGVQPDASEACRMMHSLTKGMPSLPPGALGLRKPRSETPDVPSDSTEGRE